jgi:cellulose synthase/poly-beta-1,6-N-acetylglucosamine synthase-like glycosyltransferase
VIRESIFWLATGLLGLTYAGLPLLTIVRGRRFARPFRSADVTPRVSILIAAHNEAGVIGGRLDNLLALDYPRDQFEIVIVSDGSTDGTDEIVAGYADRGIRLVAPGRVGKGAALEAAVAASSGDILVFSDANSHYATDAVRALVRPFADPTVGGVAGNQVYLREGESDGTAVGERGYWDFDRLLKRAQSAAGSVTSATGAIYAIRREHFGPIPEGVTDDMLNTIRVVDDGRRLVFAEDAVAFEPVAPSGELEFRRKVRIMTRSFRALILMRRLFDPRRTGWYAVQLFWHKVLLRTAALPLLALAVVSPLLWDRGPIFKLATIGQAVCYALAIAGIALARRPIGRTAPLAVPAYFTLVNLASLRALLNVVRGERVDRWVPRRTREAESTQARLRSLPSPTDDDADQEAIA